MTVDRNISENAIGLLAVVGLWTSATRSAEQFGSELTAEGLTVEASVDSSSVDDAGDIQ